MATTTGIKLDETMRARLQALGGLKERSPHWLMKRAIAEYLEREERYEREKQEDRRRWQNYQETGAFIGHEEMQKRLNTLAEQARDSVDSAE